MQQSWVAWLQSASVFRPDSSHQASDTWHSFPRLRPQPHQRIDIVQRINLRDQLRKERSGGDRHPRSTGENECHGSGLLVGMLPVFDRINEDMDVRAVVLAASGRAFSVGLDFFDMIPRLGLGSAGPDGERQRKLHQLIRDMQWAVTCVERCRVPVIAAIQGYCLGGAVDLITACDIRLASADAIFSVREPKVGIVADIGTLQRLPRVVGVGVARELIFTGQDIDASYAKEIGLVNRVADDHESCLADALQTAEIIARNAPLAVQGSKRVLIEAEKGQIDRELEYVATWNAAHLLSQDLATAIDSFARKTEPEFKGR